MRILESLRQSAAGPGGSPDQANNHVVPLLSTFHEPPGPRSEQRLVLVFPFLSISMADILTQAADYATKAAAKGKGEPYLTLPPNWIRYMLRSLFTALEYCHGQGIIHRDVKPGALLLSGSPFPFFTTPATTAADPATVVQVALSDFGTAYHPSLSVTLNSEPADQKCLDVGTSAYRAPECLFGHRGYTSAIDLWAAGCVVAECVSLCWAEPPSGISPPSTPATTTTTTTTAHQHKRQQDSYPGEPQPGLPHQPLFASRPANEDGSQLGLILSWFRTLGSPTREEWPEAETYKTPPFDMYRVFPKRDGGWRDVMPRVVGDDEHGKKSSDDKDSQGGDAWRELVSGLLQWEPARRTTAAEALQHRTLSQ